MVHDHINAKMTDGKTDMDSQVERAARMSRARVYFNRISLNQDQEADKRNKRQLKNKTIESDWAKPVISCRDQDNQIAQRLKARSEYNDLSKCRAKQAKERQLMKLERLSLNKKLDNIQGELHNLRKINDHLLKTFGVGHQMAKLVRDQDQEYEKLKKKCDQIAEVRIYERQKQAALTKKVQELERQTEKMVNSEHDLSNLRKMKDVREKYSHVKLVNRSSQSSTIKDSFRNSTMCNDTDQPSRIRTRAEACETTNSLPGLRVNNQSVIQSNDSVNNRKVVPLGVRKSSAPNDLQRTIALKAVQKMNLIQVPICISTNRQRPPESKSNLNKFKVQNENVETPLQLCEGASVQKKSSSLPKELHDCEKESDLTDTKDIQCNLCHLKLQDVSRFTSDTTINSRLNASINRPDQEQGQLCLTAFSNSATSKQKHSHDDRHNSTSSDGITFEEVSSSSLSLSAEDTNSAWFRDKTQSLSNSSCETLSSDDITLEITNKSFFNSTENKTISDANNITHRLHAMLRDVDERCHDITNNSDGRALSFR